MIEVLSAPLVLTKLHAPALRPRTIPRTQLLQAMLGETYADLILVYAPAGYGKTTLLAEWAQSLRQNQTAVAWYAIDPADDDSLPFGAYLVSSLIQALGAGTELDALAQHLRSSPQPDLQRVLQSLINAIDASRRPCALILDDYHLITSPDIHNAVAFLLDHCPENLQIAMGSRSDPPLPVARLRARGRLFEIRAADLRFNAAEASQFLNEVMRLELSPAAVAALEARTEGWVAGLQLAALSLSGRADKENFISSFSGSHRYLVEYLFEEVFSRQAEEVQSFLLASSILERMCAPLCDALLGKSSGSGAVLEQLEQANLFVVSLDEQGQWYRYHHLFRDFLRARLEQSQSQHIPALQQTASEWYAAHGFLREAVQHALQTGDWEYAAGVVEQHSFSMIVHSEISTLFEWCSAFPEEVMQTHPLLCILQCWAWVFSFQRQNREKIEGRLHQAEEIIATLEDKSLGSELNEHAAIVRFFLFMTPDPAADPQEQISLAKQLMSAYPEDDPGRFSSLLALGYAQMALHDGRSAAQSLEAARRLALNGQLYYGVVESSFHLARLAHCMGELHRAVEICRQAQANIASLLPHPEQDLPALGCLNIALGCVFLEQNQLAGAEQELKYGLRLIGERMNPYYLMIALTALARLYEIQGRGEESEKALSHLEEVWPDISFYTGALRAMQKLRSAPDDPLTQAEAEKWRASFEGSLDGAMPMAGAGPVGAAEAYYQAYLIWIRAQIACGNTRAARPALARLLQLSSANGLKTRVIELSLLEALANQAEGSPEQAWISLENALDAAQSEIFVRSFDQGPALARLLREAAQHGIRRAEIQRILSAIEPSRATDLPQANLLTARPELSEPLSERELEVLRLIAQGASNQAIAGQLFITVGTVKSHINHILGKLDARNRTEAVARAQEMGLLINLSI
jgi:LuxR family maltose regulon positive regulatory protein